MARLIFLGEKFAGRVYEFAIEKTTVGRGDHNTLTIQDASVSHSHCEILVYGTEVIVRDLGSSNGTVVDGKRLHKDQQHPLDHGQVVKFGAIEARLDLSVESADSETVTGWTAMHSHVRHLDDKPKPATEVTARLEASPPSAAGDHTRLLSRPSQAVEPRRSEPVAGAEAPKPRRSNMQSVIVVTAIAIGAVVICWLILSARR
ncbi:MAG TPA: FHA domain-containing protein [Verrucomicrobiae bacterium]|nr:FHA domain-containing protein [Verrucomicrobiae bacterium]